jgi:RNA recognition motif-containing protein
MAEEDDRDNRTLYVGGLSEKMSEAILYELFFQAGKTPIINFSSTVNLMSFLIVSGPIERVSIPKEKDTDRIKTFGFVTFKHLTSVPFALNVFSGTKLFGKELQLRNRNANRNRDPPQQYNQQPMSLIRGYGGSMGGGFMGNDAALLMQQKLIQLATGQATNPQIYTDAGAPQMFTGISTSSYASTRSDSAGSHRDHFVDRSRYHREENRSSRSKPYRRSRSRSPQQHSSYRSRDRSPQQPDHGRSRGERSNDKGRKSDEKQGGYHRWGKR